MRKVIKTEEFIENGVTYLREIRDNGSERVVQKPMPRPVITPRETIDQVIAKDLPGGTTLKESLTAEQRDKLLVAIAAKMGIVK